MRTLSELMNEQRETLSSRLALVLFDNVLDPEKVLQSPEIGKLAGYFFANTTLSVAQVEDPEKLHDWLRDEQYKADVQGRAMIYPVKARFEDWTLDTHGDEFSGPLYVQIFSPGNTGRDVLTITCQWSDGLFRNDYYVIGAIIDIGDMENTH